MTLILAMRLRQCRWLEKLAHMPRTRTPRKLFGGWLLEMRKDSNQLRSQPFQTISHCYNVTLRALGTSKEDAKFIQRLSEIIKQSEYGLIGSRKNLGSNKEHANGTRCLEETMALRKL